MGTMPDGMPTLSLTLHSRIAEIPVSDWDACAGTSNPFVSHAFLSALEDSGSASKRTGWLPQHAALREADQIVAVAPMYAKSHSYGEYVFDHGWANAFERAGGRYYPKLQVAGAVHSPVPGPRLLTRPGIAPQAMGQALVQACEQLGLSSVHTTFCTEAEQARPGRGRLAAPASASSSIGRTTATAASTTSSVPSARASGRVLKRERRDANAAGLTFQALRGDDIKPRHWAAFYKFLPVHGRSQMGQRLSHASRFFPHAVASAWVTSVVLMLALNRTASPVAGRVEPDGRRTRLYRPQLGLHRRLPLPAFRTLLLPRHRFCDRAQAVSASRPAPRGEHKIQRGYLPKPTFSAHWIAHPSLRRAIAEFLDHERPAVLAEMARSRDLLALQERGRVAA